MLCASPAGVYISILIIKCGNIVQPVPLFVVLSIVEAESQEDGGSEDEVGPCGVLDQRFGVIRKGDSAEEKTELGSTPVIVQKTHVMLDIGHGGQLG